MRPPVSPPPAHAVGNLDNLAVQSGAFFVLFVVFNWLVALWRYAPRVAQRCVALRRSLLLTARAISLCARLLLLRRSTSQSAKLSGGDVKRAVVEYGLETPSDFSYALCNSCTWSACVLCGALADARAAQ